MSDRLRVVALGGLGEIGMNCLVLSHGRAALAIDCGVLFPDPSLLGVDLVLPDLAFLRQLDADLLAIVLTHGHEDHIGAIPYCLRERAVPVYGPPFALELARDRLREHGLARGADLRPLTPRQPVTIGPFVVEPLRVTHSVVDSLALAIRTPVGVVVHSGDFKIDATPLDDEPPDLTRLAQLGEEGVLLLLSDSTNAERPGHTPSERAVRPAFEDIFRRTAGKILVATFASHIHRMQQVMDVASAMGRHVALVGRSMITNVGIASELGHVRCPPGTTTDLAVAAEWPAQETCLLTTGSQGEPASALSRIATEDHKQVRLEPGDTVILSSRFIPTNELVIMALIDHLYRRGADVHHERVAGVHVSGHASQEELKLLLRLVRPRYFVPIHGEYRHLALHVRLAQAVGLAPERCFLLEDGGAIEFDGARADRAADVPAGRIFVDGTGVGDISDEVLRDRRHLSADGLVTVVLGIDRHSGEVVSGPDVVARGVMEGERRQAVLDGARSAVLEALAGLSAESRTDATEVKEQVRRVLRRYFKAAREGRPVVLPLVLEM